MRVKMRIHRQHDLDLCSLYTIKSYHLGREFKRCLIAYAIMEPYIAPEFDTKDMEPEYIPLRQVININLNPNKPEEAAAIDVLEHIRPGFRCSFIKALFRTNMPYLPLLAYQDDFGFITSKNNKTAARINSIQTRHVVQMLNQLSGTPQPKLNDGIQDDTSDSSTLATTSKTNKFMPNSILNNKHEKQDMAQEMVSKDVAQEEHIEETKNLMQIIESNVEQTNESNNTDEDDFNAMFTAFDNMGH